MAAHTSQPPVQCPSGSLAFGGSRLCGGRPAPPASGIRGAPGAAMHMHAAMRVQRAPGGSASSPGSGPGRWRGERSDSRGRRRHVGAVQATLGGGDDQGEALRRSRKAVEEVARMRREIADAENRADELALDFLSKQQGGHPQWVRELLSDVPPPASSEDMVVAGASRVAAAALGVPRPSGDLPVEGGRVMGRLKRWQRRLRRRDEESAVWRRYMAAKMVELEARERAHVAAEFASRAQIEAAAAKEREAAWGEARRRMDVVREAYATVDAAYATGDYELAKALKAKAAAWAEAAAPDEQGRVPTLAGEMDQELARLTGRRWDAPEPTPPLPAVDSAGTGPPSPPGVGDSPPLNGAAAAPLNGSSPPLNGAASAPLNGAETVSGAGHRGSDVGLVAGVHQVGAGETEWAEGVSDGGFDSLSALPPSPSASFDYEGLELGVDYSMLSCDLDSRPKAAMEQDISVGVEKLRSNRRIITAGVNINADPSVVYDALTDYDALDTFIPSLTKNVVLERRPEGSRLEQFASQDVALGAKFSARVVLDIQEWASGLRPDDTYHVIPRSPEPSSPARDITFSLVESRDMREFTGTWRIQQGPAGPGTARLSYAVRVRPQVWLPVGLIEGRVSADIKQNLGAVRCYTEALREGVQPHEAAVTAKRLLFWPGEASQQQQQRETGRKKAGSKQPVA